MKINKVYEEISTLPIDKDKAQWLIDEIAKKYFEHDKIVNRENIAGCRVGQTGKNVTYFYIEFSLVTMVEINCINTMFKELKDFVLTDQWMLFGQDKGRLINPNAEIILEIGLKHDEILELIKILKKPYDFKRFGL